MPDDQRLPPPGSFDPPGAYQPPPPPRWAPGPAGPPHPWASPWGQSPPPPGITPPQRWRPRRGRSTVALAVLTVLAIGAAIGGWQSTRGAASSAAAAADAAAASRLLHQGYTAALADGSFHYVSVSTEGAVTQKTVGDAGADQGRQAITVGVSSFNVLVVGPTTYFRGDSAAVALNLGVASSTARAHAGQWISLTSGDSPYKSVHAAVSTSDALQDNLTFTPRTVVGPLTVAGQRVLGVQGPVSGSQSMGVRGTATLYVQAGGRHLPVRYVERGTATAGGGNSGGGDTGGGNSGTGNTGNVNPAAVHFQIDFSGWGEAVQVTAPTGAVAFSSLGTPGAAPPGSPPPTVLT